MIFWVFQILLDVGLVFTALGWVLAKKRVAELERKLNLLDSRPPMSEMPSIGLASALPEPLSHTNLQERKIQPEASKGRVASFALEALDRASTLLARGVDPREISRQTGLSIAELQLIGKVSHRTQ